MQQQSKQMMVELSQGKEVIGVNSDPEVLIQVENWPRSR